ncbi:MAG: hypothetical protein RLZZ210_537 [Pseudomonadota bacterium]|jgi:multidrug efflux pump
MISRIFISRPVATTLLTIAIALAGVLGFVLLPVSPLPQVEYPTISVQANLSGASPETMAATVATPLERALGAISGVTELTSSSSLGSTRITIQFDLSKNIDSAAREVQAAINSSRVLLPSSLPSNPTYRKVNPSDSPIMIISLTSDTMTRGQMYDVASTLLSQRISQVEGVGQVNIGGGALPAVRVSLDLPAINAKGISLEQVRTAIANANVNKPKGSINGSEKQWQISANDQAKTASDYLPLIITYKNNSPIYLKDIAKVSDSVENSRNMGLANGKPAVQLVIFRQPNANILETVAHVKNILPKLQSSIPSSINMHIAMERTTTIKASLLEVERSLLISIALVILVVFVFLRSIRATLIPAIAVPVSLLGTFCIMYFLGYSLNNLSLMALTIATGFVVDDAVVVLENTMRHIEKGMKPMQAALKGASEVSFTVVSMSISLIAVFIPVLAMGGIIGRLFREFAITLSVAILVSLFVSLTITPMLCAYWLKRQNKINIEIKQNHIHQSKFKILQNIISNSVNNILNILHNGYAKSLTWALNHVKTLMLIFFITIGFNVWLYINIPKGFFPQQDTGLIMGNIQADQAISFQAMSEKVTQFVNIVKQDPAVANVNAFTGGNQTNSGNMFVILKPLHERKVLADEVINRLRSKLNKVAGASLFLQSAQDLRIGGRQSNAQYQYTIQSDNLNLLREWEPKIKNALAKLPMLADINTDAQDKGLQTSIVIDRDRASSLGINVRNLDATLNDAFGQRQISTIYEVLNQYRVVMEADSRYLQNPESLKEIYLISNDGKQIPLAEFTKIVPTKTALSVNHQDQFASSTISFNLAEGVSLSQATEAIQQALAKIGVPSAVKGKFQGSAKLFQDSLSSQPLLILSALIVIYIVLGILYESLAHPITILSTLPSAGVGAILALMLFNKEFSIIAFIGVILLVGIVKKNAIIMIDVAIELERKQNLSSKDSIYQACLLRFRPILMTTLAALFGAIPLALISGEGAELRQPLGISIVGGLLVSQILTLYSTPVVYLVIDRLRNKFVKFSNPTNQNLFD